MPKVFYKLFRQNAHYFSHIEGLRAFAALRVMLHHIALFGAIFFQPTQYLEMLKHPLFKLTLSTSVLLDIFFVISGLVIGYMLISNYKNQGKVDLYDFFARRIARVFPLYLLIIIFSIPFCYSNLNNVWANILQVNNLLSMQNQYIAWTWSLAVDFQFYTFFAVIMWLISKRFIGKKTCYSLLCAALIMPFILNPLLIASYHYPHFSAKAFVLTDPECWNYVNMGFDKFYVRTSPILYGLITAYVLVYHQHNLNNFIARLPKWFINTISITIFALFVCLLANDPMWFFEQPNQVWQTSTYWVITIQRNIFSLLLCLLLLLASAPKGLVINWLLKILNSRVLRPFGRLSFTTYMIHPLVILPGYLIYFATHQSITAPAYFKQGLWLILLTYLVAIPVHLLIEHPGKLHLLRKLIRANRRNSNLSPVTV